MMLPSTTIGIDVGKQWLDAFAHPSGKARRFANTPEGIAELAGWAFELGAFAVLEATSSYDRELCCGLEASGVAYHRANPRKAREFARSAGFLAKTDKVDARMLALYGASLPLRPAQPISSQRLELQDLVARRDQLVEMRKAERTRLKSAAAAWLRESLEEMVQSLTAQIRAVEVRIKRCVADDQALREQHRLLRSAPGVGEVAAVVLMAWLPELGRIDRRAISALAGLAPIACDSGAMRGKRHIWGGRKRVRDALYMAALTACRSEAFRSAYESLRAAGKPAKLALIAIARRLLVALNAKIRDRQPFTTLPA